MSKVDAFRCDKCEQIRPASEIIGVHAIDDMFDVMKSFPIENKHPEKCEVHFCITCYNDNVFKAADRFYNRGKFPKQYQSKADELSFALRSYVVRRVFGSVPGRKK
jgi:hypothetical protein